MITYLYLENFKAITSQHFDFGKVNILCGPNNSGKSSVLAALNLIAQSVTDNASDAALVLNGRHEELGTFQDLVYAHNTRAKIVIEFGISRYKYRYEFKYRPQRREIEIVHFGLKFNDKPIYSYTVKKDSYDIKFHDQKIEDLWDRTLAKRRPDISGLVVRDRHAFEMRIGRGSRKATEAKATVDKDILSEGEEVARDVDRHLHMAFSNLRRTFTSFDSLGAFRERPIRTYLFSGQSLKRVGKTGAGAIDLLVSDTGTRGSKGKVLVEKISEWFAKTGMAKKLEIKPLTSRHFEICIQDQNSKTHNLCDVGFGCSQVLPVLVASFAFSENIDGHPKYSFSRSILIIQEPEIHLHPNAQAELGTLFAAIMGGGGQLFVETHSPYLVMRLQAEVAKKTLPNHDLKVLYVRKSEGSPEFFDLSIGPDGIFVDPWPEGFFPQRHEEALTLARLSSKAQNKA